MRIPAAKRMAQRMLAMPPDLSPAVIFPHVRIVTALAYQAPRLPRAVPGVE